MEKMQMQKGGERTMGTTIFPLFIKTFYFIVYLYRVQFLIPWLNKM